MTKNKVEAAQPDRLSSSRTLHCTGFVVQPSGPPQKASSHTHIATAALQLHSQLAAATSAHHRSTRGTGARPDAPRDTTTPPQNPTRKTRRPHPGHHPTACTAPESLHRPLNIPPAYIRRRLPNSSGAFIPQSALDTRLARTARTACAARLHTDAGPHGGQPPNGPARAFTDQHDRRALTRRSQSASTTPRPP